MFSSGRHAERRKALQNWFQIYRIPAKIKIFLKADDLISPCFLLVRNTYTRDPLADTNVLLLKILRILFLAICLTLRRLMSYIYEAPILDVSGSHTTTQHSR